MLFESSFSFNNKVFYVIIQREVWLSNCNTDSDCDVHDEMHERIAFRAYKATYDNQMAVF